MAVSGTQVLVLLATVLVLCQCVPPPVESHAVMARSAANEQQYMESVCRILCSWPDSYCPPECSLASFTKRSSRFNRARKYGGDYSFDDFMFMKLLGRNLGDQN